jgi:hypothetical protein
VNARDSLRQASPHGYRHVLRPSAGPEAWCWNPPKETASPMPYADQLAVWGTLVNPAEKPAVGDEPVAFDPISAEHLATGLAVGFREG